MSNINVLSIVQGADTAGIGWLLAGAFYRGQQGVFLRSAVRSGNYIGYPHDLSWTDAKKEWQRANVVHIHNTFNTWFDFGADKPVVVHHHGTFYRNHATMMNNSVAKAGGRAVVATLDLLDYGDDLVWCPAPYSLGWLKTFRRPREGKLRIGHAPTNRDLKSTETFLRVCKQLDVEPVLIERKPWMECLNIKGTCDVLFDQVQLGYGHNAIEAWGMGIPVIAGGAPSTLAKMRETFGELPFFEADEQTIGDAIKAMMDPTTRSTWAQNGLEHVRTWHSGEATVNALVPIYRALAAV